MTSRLFKVLCLLLISQTAFSQAYLHFDNAYQSQYQIQEKKKKSGLLALSPPKNSEKIVIYHRKFQEVTLNPFAIATSGLSENQIFIKQGEQKFQPASVVMLEQATGKQEQYAHYYRQIHRLKTAETASILLGAGLIASGILHTVTTNNIEGKTAQYRTSPMLYMGATVGLSSLIWRAIRKKKIRALVDDFNQHGAAQSISGL
ncbi:hypothetical protein [Persicobacter psychrovividus]|uniref:Uncharacterized protein n=1 Tax=Persicobacter psychrovividus TaxID=387638 RepID=A0ABM7VFK3_9BACT|nr:hypothetical protein PEPS_19280 [Persicobacter psychrovividus]